MCSQRMVIMQSICGLHSSSAWLACVQHAPVCVQFAVGLTVAPRQVLLWVAHSGFKTRTTMRFSIDCTSWDQTTCYDEVCIRLYTVGLNPALETVAVISWSACGQHGFGRWSSYCLSMVGMRSAHGLFVVSTWSACSQPAACTLSVHD